VLSFISASLIGISEALQQFSVDSTSSGSTATSRSIISLLYATVAFVPRWKAICLSFQ
jgi:hypothetical protein